MERPDSDRRTGAARCTVPQLESSCFKNNEDDYDYAERHNEHNGQQKGHPASQQYGVECSPLLSSLALHVDALEAVEDQVSQDLHANSNTRNNGGQNTRTEVK